LIIRSSLFLNIKSRSFSSMQIHAFFSSIILALYSWWFSATLGEGIKIDGLPAIANSERVNAPLLAITMFDEI